MRDPQGVGEGGRALRCWLRACECACVCVADSLPVCAWLFVHGRVPLCGRGAVCLRVRVCVPVSVC